MGIAIHLGPCWLLVQDAKRRESEAGATGSMISWCKVEYTINNYRSLSPYHDSHMLGHAQISLPQTPPLTVLTLLMRTMLNTKTQEHEIVCACGLVSQKFGLDKPTTPSTMKGGGGGQPPLYDTYFCVLTRPSAVVFPYDLQNALKSMNKTFRIELCQSERGLLSYLLCKVTSFDVDVIVGHDLFGFNFDILLNRCLVNKVPHWSRMGRLKRATMPNMPNQASSKQKQQQQFAHSSNTMNLIIQQRIQTVCSGRLLCDIMISSKELLTKCKSFDLAELALHILFRKDKSSMLKRDPEEERNVAAYYQTSNTLISFLQLAMLDVTYILRMCNDLQCLQLAYQITCIAGNVLSRTLTGGRAERNEYLLLHAFYDRDFVLPEKQSHLTRSRAASAAAAATAANLRQRASRTTAAVKAEPSTQNEEEREDEMLCSMMAMSNDAGEATMSVDVKEEKQPSGGKSTHSAGGGAHTGYAGGLVLEPRVGFYDKFILLLDFNSLYPSIIQEYNICFTTISRPQSELLDRDVDEVLFYFFSISSNFI